MCCDDADRSASLASGFPAAFPQDNAGAGRLMDQPNGARLFCLGQAFYALSALLASFPSRRVRVCRSSMWCGFLESRKPDQSNRGRVAVPSCLAAVLRLLPGIQRYKSCFGLLSAFGYLLACSLDKGKVDTPGFRVTQSDRAIE